MKPGRKTKFTPAVRAKILSCIEKGMALNHSAIAAGISPASLHNYRQQFPEFNTELEEAAVAGIEARIQVIEDAQKRDWRSAAWMLQHSPASAGAYRERVQVTADTPPIPPLVVFSAPGEQPKLKAAPGQLVVQFVMPAKVEPQPGIDEPPLQIGPGTEELPHGK